jgi:hypothetical protein
MADTEYFYVIPNEILNDLWPQPVPPWIYKHKDNTRTYVEHLDRYVDMGVLSRSGTGAREDPFRYEVLLSTLGTQLVDEGYGYKTRKHIGWRHDPRSAWVALVLDDVPQDLLDRLFTRDAG